MRALMATRHGGPEVLELREDVAAPVAGRGLVLVRVASAGVNFADIMALQGKYPAPPPPFVPGLEIAGVEETTGRPVMALVPSGGFAELVAAAPILVFDADGIDLREAGGYPLATFTCYIALKRVAKLEPGESLLVLAGAGGIGSTAIQIARALGAGRIVAVASTPEKRAFAVSNGADLALGYDDDLPACNVTLDGVGGAAFAKAYRAAPTFGRMVLLGASSGEPPAFADFGELRNRSVALMPFSFGALRKAQPELVASIAPEVLALLRKGLVRPPLGRSLPLARGAEALRMLAERRTTGKLVLLP